jgi:hypothetical protein
MKIKFLNFLPLPYIVTTMVDYETNFNKNKLIHIYISCERYQMITRKDNKFKDMGAMPLLLDAFDLLE